MTLSIKNLESVIVKIEKHVARLTLSRPEVRNAFGANMIRELTHVFSELNNRQDLRVVIIEGAGKSFCSGADLGYMKSMADFTLEENEGDSDALFTMFWTMRSCPHPVVGRLHGHVMGGGLGLAAICDIACAIEGTQFCFSEVKLGLAPAVISPFVLERMSMAHARRFMLTGEVFSAQDAKESGLVQFVGSETELEKFLSDVVTHLSLNGPEAMRATKGLLRAVGEISDASLNWGRRRELTTKLIAERRVSVEGQEGLRSFLEKRVPKWRL